MATEKEALQKYQSWETVLSEEQFDEIVQTGNIGLLSMAQRSSFLWWKAKRAALDPTTNPFDLIPGQNGKLVVYANRNASDQLRKIHTLSTKVIYDGPLKVGEELNKTVWITKVEISNPEGRKEEHVGAVGIEGLSGEALANAIMKCSTKASRRGTLAFCGISVPDETEVSAFAQTPVEVSAQNSDGKPPAPKMLQPPKPLPVAAPPIKV